MKLKPTQHQYSAEFKLEAVQQVVLHQQRVVKVARSLGIEASTLGKWVRQYRAEMQGIAPRMQPMQHTYPIASSDKRMISIQYASSAIWSQKEMLALQLLDSIISQKLRFAMREQAGGVYALGFSQMLAKLPSPYYSARLNFTSAPERADEIPPAKKVMP